LPDIDEKFVALLPRISATFPMQRIFEMPKGYIFAEVNIRSVNAEWSEYSSKVQATLDAYGGVFLIRGGMQNALEGETDGGTIVVLEFESPQRAEQWYASAAYQDILPLRLRNADARVMCLSGTD
jgi:uncharacterized protein (DUF1330 family)